MEDCEPCEIVATLRRTGDLYELTPRWTVNAAQHWITRPWLVLQTAVHRAGLADLDEAEAAELGPVTRAVTIAMTEVTGAAKVYVYLLNETQPPHVHIHLMARFPGDPPENRGPALFGTPALDADALKPAVVAEIAARAQEILGHQPQGSVG